VAEQSSFRVGVKMATASGLGWWLGGLTVHVHAAAAALVPLIVFRNDDPWNVWRGIIGRFVGVIVGVGLAVIILTISHPSAWWVVLIVAATAAIQAAPRIGEPLFHNWQIAVSGVLVLGVGPGPYGAERLVETLVGGGVTLVVANVVWPPDPAAELRRRLTRMSRTLSEDLRQVPGLLGASRETTRAFEHHVLEHTAFSDATVADIALARRSLRFSVRRWTNGAKGLEDAAERIRLLGSLYHVVDVLAHDLVHLAPRGDGIAAGQGEEMVYEATVTALASVIDRATNTPWLAVPGLLEGVDTALSGSRTAAGPRTAVVASGLQEIADGLGQLPA
jgi:hypothetical protein